MVGSADFDDPAIAGQVNVALQPRQPGSAIKPVLYATALERNAISPATVIWDTPVEYLSDAGQAPYAPRNYDGDFHGPVTVRTALANSYNIPAVKLLAGVGVNGLLAGAQNLGINSLDRGTDWYGLSLALGGGEVTLLELTTAFHTLAGDGLYLPPDPVLSLVDNLGNQVVFESPEPRAAVSPETAFLISDILSDNEARTPAFGANNPLQLDVPAAVKTGTTTDFRDNWTVGYTPTLVAGVWAGNSDGTPMRNATGVTGAAPIWRDFMTQVQASPQLSAALESSGVSDGTAGTADTGQFLPPQGVVKLDRCPPSVTCRGDGEYYRSLWLDGGVAGALPGDGVVMVPSAPVYVQRDDSARLAGFCTVEGGAMDRPLLTLDPLSIPDDAAGFADVDGVSEESSALGGVVTAVLNLFAAARTNEQPADNVDGATPNDGSVAQSIDSPTENPAGDDILAAERWPDEKLAALAWSLEFGAAVDLGPCDELQVHIGEALERRPIDGLNGQRVLVDMGAAYNTDVGEPGQIVAMSTLRGAVDVVNIVGPGPSAGPGLYAVTQPVIHDNACPGRYIMGRIVNAEGGPVPGVTVVSRDEWGNSAHSVSKSGQVDFGQFDLPVNSDTPHTIYVTVVDGAGNPISPTVSILHGQGEAGTAPCHHVVFQGGA